MREPHPEAIAYVVRASLTSARDPAALQTAKLRLLDYVGALAGGFGNETSHTFSGLLECIGGSEEATFAPTALRTSMIQAAGGNAAVAHSCETDDVHLDTTGYHPGTTLIPAVLAVGEARSVHGADLLKAIVVGYEVGGRIGASITPSHRLRGFHATGTIGALGAAAAAATAMGLSETQIISAVGLATSMAAGTFAVLSGGAQAKHLHAYHAATSGVLAAMLSAEGMCGSSRALETAGGFFDAFSDSRNLDRLFSGAALGHEIDQVMVKPFPCCAHAFGAVDLAVELSSQLDIDAITAIDIKTYQAAAVLGDKAPASAAEAKLSLSYCVAAALEDGVLSGVHFEPERIAHIVGRGLLDRVHLSEDAEANAAFPGERLTRLTVYTRDGSLERSVRQPPGSRGRAMSRADVVAKFHAAAEPVFGPAANEIEAIIVAFDTCPDGAGHLGRSMMPSDNPAAVQRTPATGQSNGCDQRTF